MMLLTVLLGIAFVVVLVLYLHANDQISQLKARLEELSQHMAEDVSDGGAPQQTAADVAGGEALSGAGQKKGQKEIARQNPSAPGESYEEIYAHFLAAMEACALSERELEVAWLLYRGYTNRQIGEALYIAESTVKKHVSHIYEKMNVQSRKEFRTRVQTAAVPVATTPLS